MKANLIETNNNKLQNYEGI